MINPSSVGWIDKFFAEQKMQRVAGEYSELDFFRKIRATGLVYGYPISFENIIDFDTSKWTPEEFTKVALLDCLYDAFAFQSIDVTSELFLISVHSFYKKMQGEGFNFFQKVFSTSVISYTVEKIIDDRVQTNNSLLARNFSHILTNALLFEDVLAYYKFLETGEISSQYLKKLEETIVSVVLLALSCKSKKSSYDDLLIKLFETSVRYTKFSQIDIKNMESLQLEEISSSLEKFYIIDLAVLAVWNEDKIDQTEQDFVLQIASKLQVSQDFVTESIAASQVFLSTYKTKIPFFNYSNPVKHFYDHASDSVKVLITRNKDRLLKELSNNTELMILLTKSATKGLDDKEKKKVKKQLLEVCKTIPSLAVFLLPGGTLLLPILVKFIPKMLPTAFNENLQNEKL